MFAAVAALMLAGSAPAATEAAIRAASREFDDAQLHGDRAVLERYLAPDFLFVRGSGKVTGRQEFIDTFAGGTLKLEPFTIVNRSFVGLGADAGIMAAEGTMRGTANGKPFVDHFRFADTFLRRGGRWQVVYVQVTPLP
ncbi:nuclear transport factor 2 family protein [Sphingomonas quercus]|uniref:Nuclear transport factor 2 family protein n=1 Tax=Sphingomonas quercus TaxID=2842451 RepID=A0ABS6BHD7_9SPHN|nr:nuclear transport factor 2 family protein [Sphingomonas quercus]MBU3077720.1 nuclear transport factor 2 family protein [Sphingomonas quercus]